MIRLKCICMDYVYIDESGDLGTQSTHFVIAALFVKDDYRLDRIIKNMRRNKFKKQLKRSNEIKANKSKPEIIKHILKNINGVPHAKAFFVVLEKEKCYSKFLKNDKHKFYNYVAGKLASNITLENDAVIRIDKSKGKQMLREDFNRYFMNKLPYISCEVNIEIHHSYSHSWSGLQFADILAWSAFQKVEHGNSEYIDMLKVEKEVFEVW